jgi:lactoylglutathione lyase
MIDAQQKSREFIFGHISLYVNDMDKAVEFYTKILGMKLIKRRGETKQDKAERAFLASNDGIYRIELTLPKSKENRLERLDHIAFYVKDLDNTIDWLKQQGIPIITGPIDVITSGIRIAFIKDNEGTLIELIERLE